jgi:hypothetical protein
MNERREHAAQQRELEHDRRHERWLALYGVLALVPVAAIIVVRQLFFA